MAKVGVYSGTFDPVHAGHVAFAETAMEICKLDEVVFLPERVPRNKQGVTKLTHRLALLERAIGTLPGMRALTLDAEQFTIRHTLPQLEQLFPDSEMVLLIGSDVAKSLVSGWPDLVVLLQKVSLAIGLRQGDTPATVDNLMQQLGRAHGISVTYATLVTAHAGATSSAARQYRTSTNLHPKVHEYIKRHSLYQ